MASDLLDTLESNVAVELAESSPSANDYTVQQSLFDASPLQGHAPGTDIASDRTAEPKILNTIFLKWTHELNHCLEGIGPGGRWAYELLLGQRGIMDINLLDDDAQEPLILCIGDKDLIEAALLERSLKDSSVKELLESVQDTSRDDIDQKRKELKKLKEVIGKALQRARRELRSKWFIEILPGDAFTHATIGYSIFLPLAVLERMRLHGAVRWRHGGNRGRVLVDALGNDIPA